MGTLFGRGTPLPFRLLSKLDPRDVRDGKTFARGRSQGLAAGLKRGRELSSAAGERRGLAAGQQAAVGQTTTGGTTTDQSGSTGSSGGTAAGTPSVDSTQGKQILKSSPECRDHPPPPGYHGPVQC